MNIKTRYKINKQAKTGDKLLCPSCGTEFVKTHYAQAFCKSKTGTQCKDKYWNTVTPEKRCNTTRISPASAAYMESRDRYTAIDDMDADHPFSSEGLGQWID
jgi:hypothetical protein